MPLTDSIIRNIRARESRVYDVDSWIFGISLAMLASRDLSQLLNNAPHFLKENVFATQSLLFLVSLRGKLIRPQAQVNERRLKLRTFETTFFFAAFLTAATIMAGQFYKEFALGKLEWAPAACGVVLMGGPVIFNILTWTSLTWQYIGARRLLVKEAELLTDVQPIAQKRQ